MEPQKKLPFLSPLLAMLESRKGIVVLVVVIGCMTAMWAGKIHFAEIKEFLIALLVAYFGAQAYEDAKRNENAAKQEQPKSEPKPESPPTQ